ncbi:VOC family protein [Bacillus mesophilum]|uniref:VOC family protein n=1 Tax=Bacillus mesophilum TaxID=1071718 RepID=A0A7V7RKI5_9BACI|nr:VOC family protein [Bacillus mesophilum]KAB2331819.1 VOC family protein [Bacillus mesophilum]
MSQQKLIRVGTQYIPVENPEQAANWYKKILKADISYCDKDKAIVNFANQSFFLVKGKDGESANFIDYYGEKRFSMTFEVNGLESLQALHKELKEKGVGIGEIEDRGHAGRNFVFSDRDGNLFDVWSELSPAYK